VLAAISTGLVGRRAGGGSRRARQTVFQLEDNPLGGFLADAGNGREPRQIAALDGQIAEEQQQLRKTKAEYATFVRSVYKSNADPLAQLLGAPDFQTFLNRAVAIEHLTYLSNRLMDHIHQVDLLLHNQEEGVKSKKKEADKDRADLVDQKAALLKQQAHQQDLEKRLRQSISQVKWELVAINGQSAALAQRIADMEIARQDQLIAEAEQAAWQQAQFWMQHNLFTLPGAGAGHSTKYPLIWPLQQGSLTLLFGPCTQTFEPPGFGYAHFHAGVDIAYNQGSPILAADDGVVVAASSSVVAGVTTRSMIGLPYFDSPIWK